MRVKEGSWANFSCTVPCPKYGIIWYRAGIDFSSDYPEFGLNVTKQVPQTCNSNREWTYFLSVLATKAANNTAIYCATDVRQLSDGHCGCGCPGTDRCYSRPSLLIGMQLFHALSVLVMRIHCLVVVIIEYLCNAFTISFQMCCMYFKAILNNVLLLLLYTNMQWSLLKTQRQLPPLLLLLPFLLHAPPHCRVCLKCMSVL